MKGIYCMSKITTAINNYFSYKELIKEQISKEEKHIEECSMKVKNLLDSDLVRLHIKANGNHPTIKKLQDAITCHKKNIEKLKCDIKFLFEFMSKEEKKKQALINLKIMYLIDCIERDVECRQQPEWHKPGNMSIDEFIEEGKEIRKKLKHYIERLLDGDFELYHELVQLEREN